MPADLLERISDKFTVGDGCWEWTGGCRPEGYGQITFQGRCLLAHRVLYELLVGPIPEGHELDHACHTADLTCPGGWDCPHRRCVRPDHLDPLTQAEHFDRSRTLATFHRDQTHCIHDHAFDAANTIWSIRKDGRVRRQCRTCNNARRRAARAARNAR